MTFLKRLTAAWTTLRSGSTGTISDWLRGGSSGSTPGSLANPLEQSPWVYACVQYLARNVASLPYQIRNAKQIQESGPVVELFARPHAHISSTDFWELTVAWMLMRGRCFIAGLDRNGRYVALSGPLATLPASLVILPADRVQPIHSAQILMGWRYSAAFQDLSQSQALLPEEVLFIPMPNPFDHWAGLSPMTVANLAASTDRAAGLFQRGLAESNGELGFLVTSEHQLTDEQIAQVKAALAERRRGAGVAARPLFLPNGSKVEKPAVSSADAQFLENRRWSRQEICAVFGVPESLLGIVENTNLANGQEQHEMFIYNTLTPLVRRIDSAIASIARLEDLDAAHDINSHPVMITARQRRLDTAMKAVGIGVSFNEANEVLGLGFKPQPWGDTWYKPFSLESVEAPTPDPAAPAPAAPPAKSLDPFTALAALVAKGLDAPAHECRGSDAFAKSIRGAVNLMRRRMSKVFYDQRTRVLAKLAAKGKTVATPLQKDVRGLPEDVWDSELEDKILTESLGRLLRDNFTFGVAQTAKELGLMDFTLAPLEALKFLEGRKKEIKGINDTTFASIKSELSEALNNGESYASMADRIREVFTDAGQSRAETIAQTEVGIAVNTGRYTAMTESGVTHKAWLDSNLEGSRQSHIEAGVRYSYDRAIEIGDTFDVGGEQLDHPGDPAGSPGNVINCRCTVLAVLLDDATKQLRCVHPKTFLDYREFAAAEAEKTHPEKRAQMPQVELGGMDTPPTPQK
jgi:HK97 family phage portal protein